MKEENVTKYVGVTQFQTHHAREAFPCLDEPDLKAKFVITINHNENLTARSNMEMEESIFIGDVMFISKCRNLSQKGILIFLGFEANNFSRICPNVKLPCSILCIRFQFHQWSFKSNIQNLASSNFHTFSLYIWGHHGLMVLAGDLRVVGSNPGINLQAIFDLGLPQKFPARCLWWLTLQAILSRSKKS